MVTVGQTADIHCPLIKSCVKRSAQLWGLVVVTCVKKGEKQTVVSETDRNQRRSTSCVNMYSRMYVFITMYSRLMRVHYRLCYNNLAILEVIYTI